jgi:hypothetical protein
VQTSVDNFGSILATEVFPTQYSTFTNQSIDLSAASFQGVTNITIRVCGYVNNAAAAIYFNNFTINGVLGQPVAASNTTISASPASITADGASTSTVTVQARDANNNIISSSRGIVTLSASDGSLGSVTDNQNGTYTAILTSPTTVGTAYITGTIAGAAIGVPTSVALIPGPVSAANTVISANPVSIAANGVSTLSVTVQARDANNNNLTSSGGAVDLNRQWQRDIHRHVDLLDRNRIGERCRHHCGHNDREPDLRVLYRSIERRQYDDQCESVLNSGRRHQHLDRDRAGQRCG